MVEAARPATPEDLAAVQSLADEATAALADQRGGPHYLALEAPAALQVAPDAALIVGTIDDAVVGFLAAREVGRRDGGRHVGIEALWVTPEAREVGVGECMLDAVLDWGRARGCDGVDAIALPGDRSTKNFFESFGLVARAIVVHRTFDDA
ncbi:MAG: GNAT family N-acetyltransferase [Acidimicrobiales bacterium]|nr:GNAT family N-acetyltransferase [Acidimicrobiales bacterium]MCB1259709.1 GNAT family N-acetyltransferase [Acidimicrobiales bacterium]